MTSPTDLEIRRDADGSYVVRAPETVRDPADRLAVTWVAVGTIGLAPPFVGVAALADGQVRTTSTG